MHKREGVDNLLSFYIRYTQSNEINIGYCLILRYFHVVYYWLKVWRDVAKVRTSLAATTIELGHISSVGSVLER